MKETLEYFVVYLMAPLILAFGLFGNITGIIVLSREKLIKIGSRNTFRYLLSIDSIYLVQILQPYLANPFNHDLTIQSNLACKLFYYFNYSLDVISPWLLVYISIEKYVSITNQFKTNVFRRTSYQRFYLLFITLFILCYYLPFVFIFTMQQDQTVCNFKNVNYQTLLTSMDLIIRVLVPFILMSIFTILIIKTIFESRNRVRTQYTHRQNRTFQRDIKFSITSILLNLIYFVLSLLISVIFFVRRSNDDILVYLLALYLFYMCYACNFYLILASNSLFRNEFLMIFKRKRISFDFMARTSVIKMKKSSSLPGFEETCFARSQDF